jgi:hypothetical protein
MPINICVGVRVSMSLSMGVSVSVSMSVFIFKFMWDLLPFRFDRKMNKKLLLLSTDNFQRLFPRVAPQ